ncbi:MAG TPA: hypothetical protein PKM56_01485 [Candidatus Rifleibacterium sp.]|nr:hypothetical protein [Candidatus Rifleibacterium sp.]
MLQPSHRGIYEFLWSEHKYPVMAVSLKAFQGMAARLGRRPQLLALLRKIAEYTYAERTENYNALLNAYLHIKPLISRARRHEIIETLLSDEARAAGYIYADALKNHDTSLSGCRLFFAPEHAIYKFWDAQDRPGLWLCFGPVQLHLTPQQVFNRICHEAFIAPGELLKKLHQLRGGIDIGEFSSWDRRLQTVLQQNNLVAVPGGGSVWLHPRLPFDSIAAVNEIYDSDFLTAALFSIEKIWDAAEYPPELIGQLPDYALFSEAYHGKNHPAIIWKPEFSCDEAFEFVGHLFWQQWCKDNGQAGKDEPEAGSAASIGMETADQEIDPEEGEHGDDETGD